MQKIKQNPYVLYLSTEWGRVDREDKQANICVIKQICNLKYEVYKEKWKPKKPNKGKAGNDTIVRVRA